LRDRRGAWKLHGDARSQRKVFPFMPTAAKLFAALALAAVCYLTAEVIRPYLPPGTQARAFAPLSGLIGLLAGWRIIGPDMGRGMVPAFFAGLRAALFVAVAGLLIFSTIVMVNLSWRGTYDGPFDAVLGIVDLAIGFIPALVKPDVLAALVIGSGLSGVFAEWAARRWT